MLDILDQQPDAILDRVLSSTAEYEFRSFVLGIQRRRDYVREVHESAYRELKIVLGTRLSELWPDRVVEFENPELRIDLRARRDGSVGVRLQSTPWFVGGRYRKLSREIPACRWMHMPCRGKGCRSCGFTGNVCGPSIQELAEPIILESVGGTETFFHGAGREDIDVRMLGSGRPFAIEVRHPKRRNVDLERLTREINVAAEGYAEVHKLAVTGRHAMVAAKSAAADKTYRARVQPAGAIPADLAQRLATLCGARVEQLSPTRVMKRRGKDTVRLKQVVDSSLIDQTIDEFVWEVQATSGTYVKELVSGDDGRTTPSLSSLLGVPCECIALDVMEIHWTAPWEK